MPDYRPIRLQFTIRQAAILVLIGCITLALSLWLTRRNGVETAVNLVQVAVIAFALHRDRRATLPGVVGGGLLAAGDCVWTVLGAHRPTPFTLSDYRWLASVSFYWATYAGWFGAGASALVRGRHALGIGLVVTAILWLAATFLWMLSLSRAA